MARNPGNNNGNNDNTIAGFGKYSGDTDLNPNSNSDNNNNSDLGSILNKGKKRKDQTHTFRGFYLENEVVRVLDNVTAGKGKGSKSDLINDILKKVFQEEGLM